jgi:hypothetical protein
MSDQQFEGAVRDWLGDGSDRTPRPAVDAVLLAVKTTPQERDLRIPWRFPHMPAFARLTGIVAVALVAVVAAGGVIYLNSRVPTGPAGLPTVGPTPAPTLTLQPGITGWTPYTSAAYGLTVSYPADWSVNAPAVRKWQAGDGPHGDVWPFADTFASPDQETVGLLVWQVPAGDGADLGSVEGWKAWAGAFCDAAGASACAEFTQRSAPMCQDAGGDACRPAILVPTAEGQYGFFLDWGSSMLTSVPDRVTVVLVPREDGFPSAARYGGSVELLRAILTTMDIWTPGQQPPG